jgi:hypothetical protein
VLGLDTMKIGIHREAEKNDYIIASKLFMWKHLSNPPLPPGFSVLKRRSTLPGVGGEKERPCRVAFFKVSPLPVPYPYKALCL